LKVATIDIGTNSVLLLIAETLGDHGPSPVHEVSTITRLGQGVDKDRCLHPDAIHRTLLCLEDYARRMQEHHVERLDVVTTSAARDAVGVDAFLDAAERILGARPRVISGEAEARLTFLGALSGLSVAGPVAVYDIGGGSTEIVFGRVEPGRPPTVHFATSLDVGCVRLTERHVRQDPPSRSELDAVRGSVDALLGGLVRSEGPLTWVGIGGTITALVAVELGLAPYDPSKVHGSNLTVDQVAGLVQRLGDLPVSERRFVPGLDPKRADVIVTGGCIVQRLLAWSGAYQTCVSDRGVRWGLAIELGSPTLF
jgi:exopolyphosphatase/guanosine-5'-triphosphate,3'-diphosphate pyrophosphatase